MFDVCAKGVEIGECEGVTVLEELHEAVLCASVVVVVVLLVVVVFMDDEEAV